MKTWIAIWQQAHLGSGRTGYYLTPLIWFVLTTVSTAVFWPECKLDPHTLAGFFARLGGLLVALLGLALWVSHLRSLNVQLAPAAVQLVPTLQRHAIACTQVLWLAISGAIALGLSVFGLPFPLLAAAVAASLALAASMRYGAGLGLLSGLALLVAPFARSVFPRVTWQVAPWAAGTLLVAAVLGGGAWIARELGGTAERRFGPFARQRLAQLAWQERRLESTWSAFLLRPSVYPHVFEGVLRTAAPEARMLHGLGPIFHWSHVVFGGVAQTVIAGGFYYALFACMTAVLAAPGEDLVSAESILRAIVPMTFIFAMIQGESHLRTLDLRRKEQALLRLLPGVPHGRELNRWLMLSLLTRYLAAVAFGLAFLVPLMLSLRQPLESALQLIAAPFAVSLLTAPVLVRNYATMRPRARLPHFLLGAIPACALLQLGIMSRRIALDPWAVILISAGLSALLVAVRFVQLVEAPVAFPVGRLAD